MQKYFFVFIAGVLITLLGILGFNKLNGNKVSKQPIAITDQYSCLTDSDCEASCSYGCVNSNWAKDKVTCEAIPNITCACFNGQCTDTGFVPEQSPEPSKDGCYVQGCHGLDIQCGPSEVKECDAMYQVSDGCRQLARCETINGKCGPTLDRKFSDCKNCIENCENKYVNDPIELQNCATTCF